MHEINGYLSILFDLRIFVGSPFMIAEINELVLFMRTFVREKTRKTFIKKEIEQTPLISSIVN